MKEGRLLRIGGYISGGILIVLGLVVIVLGVWGFSFTRDHIEREGITFGPATDPAVQEHAEQWAGEPVDTGRKALAQAEIMREHTLSGSGGLTYAQLGRYQSAENPSDPAGTVRDAFDLQHHRRDRAAAYRDRPRHPRARRVRTMATGRADCRCFDPCCQGCGWVGGRARIATMASRCPLDGPGF